MPRESAVSEQQILEKMKSAKRPVWTALSLSEEFATTKVTIQKRLRKLEAHPHVHMLEVGRAHAYYYDEYREETQREGLEQSINETFAGEWCGTFTNPSSATFPEEGETTAGDVVQLVVEGEPGAWSRKEILTGEDMRTQLTGAETRADRTQAIIESELVAKPTAPLCHVEIPAEYPLEERTGARWVSYEASERPSILADGPQNYLLNVCDDAVHLSDIEVVDISPEGQGSAEVDAEEIDEEDMTVVSPEEVEDALNPDEETTGDAEFTIPAQDNV